MVKARKYVVVKKFDGEPKKSDFQIVEEELPQLQNGEYLLKAEYISFDPYLRAYAHEKTAPYDQFSYQVGSVIESKNKNFPVGTKVVGHYGWREYTVVDPKVKHDLFPSFILPDLSGTDLNSSVGLGLMGMPGATAYLSLFDVGKPKAGETIVISGAAGAVGVVVGQIAKIKGLRVIGIAGSEEKVKFLVNEVGFDYAINYKTDKIDDSLKKAAPNGVDCYYDNVGGQLSSIVMSQMTKNGRVIVIGCISTYNSNTMTDEKGLRVIGIAGSEEKVKFLVNEVGFDYAINYKTDKIDDSLKKAAPNGVDCYYDNVGGQLSSIVMSQMTKNGRVIVIGCISTYNSNTMTDEKATILQPSILFNTLTVQGFLIWDHPLTRWEEAFKELKKWVLAGKMKVYEDVTEGFEKLDDAFIGILKGKNVGKAVVKV